MLRPKPASKKKSTNTRPNWPRSSSLTAPEKFTFPQLEETYNEIRDERTKLSLELGDVLKARDRSQGQDG